MEKVELCSDEEGFHLLHQLEHILDCDPLIDEVGFIHPSQQLMLNEEAGPVFLSSGRQDADTRMSSEPCVADGVGSKYAFFWNRDHKDEVMKHGKCLLLLSSDFGAAWNARRWVIKRIIGRCASLEKILEEDFVEKISEASFTEV